jgi:hypothetical protein
MENDKLKNKNVETFAEDMAKAIESDKEGGIIKKIILEQEQHEAIKKNLSPTSQRNRIFMLMSVILLFLGFVTLVFFGFFHQSVSTVAIISPATPIIFTDQTDFVSIDGLTKDKIEDTVFNQNNNNLKTGQIDGIYLTENQKVVDFGRLNTLIKSDLTSNQLNLFGGNFLIGKLSTEVLPPSSGGNTSVASKDFFILLKVSSFTDIFPVMMTWENKMFDDLHGFFGINLSPETSYLFTKNFEDQIIDNKNARVLTDKDGNIVFMYVFADDSSVIITNSLKATEEVILRLNSSKIKK